MSYLKPQNPIQLGEDYIYPLTTSDQVILNNGNRLNSLFKKTIKENITLLSSNWSEALPYMQTVTLNESTDDYNVDANVIYGGDNDVALNKAASCISYIKKNHKEITFYCLKKKPEIDIPVEITGTCRNTIATVEEGVKLNFDIKRYSSEEEMLADTPMENTIGIISDVEISGYRFSATEPTDMIEGEVWIKTGYDTGVTFDIIDNATLHLISAKQYIDGIWIDLTAKSYQDDTWVSWWNGELYTLNNEWEFKTGAWYIDRNMSATLTKNASGMTFVSSSDQESSGITMRNAMSINYDNYTVVKVTISNFNPYSAVNGSAVMLSFRTGTSFNSSSAISETKRTAAITSDTTLSIPIPSNAQKAFYIRLYQSSVTIKKIWME